MPLPALGSSVFFRIVLYSFTLTPFLRLLSHHFAVPPKALLFPPFCLPFLRLQFSNCVLAAWVIRTSPFMWTMAVSLWPVRHFPALLPNLVVLLHLLGIGSPASAFRSMWISLSSCSSILPVSPDIKGFPLPLSPFLWVLPLLH